MYIDQVKERWHKIGKDSLALAVHAHLYQWYRQLKSGIMFMGWVLLGLGLIALLVELLSRLPGWFGPIMFGPRQAVILMDKLSQVDQQLPPDVKLYFNTTSGANWLPLLIPVAGAILLYIVLAVLQPKLFPKPEQHIAYLVSLSAALALVTLFILPRFAPDLADQFQLCIVAYAIVAHARVTFNKKFAWLTEGLILLIVLLSIVFSGLQSYHAQIPLPTPSGDIVFKSLQLPIEKPDQWLLRIPMLGIQVGGTTQVFLLGIWLLGLLCLHIFTAIGLHERNARTRSDTLVKELTAAQEQLRAYALHAEDLATMRERSRVAREVHDTLAQGLAAIKMHLETGTQLFTASPQLASEHMELARELAGAYLKETRDSILDLRSDALDGRSLPSALAALVATWQDESGTHGPGGQVSFCVSRPPADAPLWQTLPRPARLPVIASHKRRSAMPVSMVRRSISMWS
ncbi:histidine kinase [Ktedonosporobacter rubrisoli]|uniref:Histidine kinase n=1 Tax=Ktedonosporobacter rubrisoli TaxID=2509675 RepID=A0A4P6JY24_KTERU|nr:histidine kinase dimerization/phosphoacceptor domain-containing protein [Ktedonosporobacter rubrisoli]QBD80688.1 histidine kinase [Ktedonosporobacter rubrisoli]